MLEAMFNYGATPALEKLVQFTGARHAVLTDNIANLSTPFYKPRDLDPGAFQTQLRRAIDDRRRTATPEHGKLELNHHGPLRFDENGRVELRTSQNNRNILFHDRNNRDLERTMADLAENTLAHNAGVNLLKNEFDMLRMAISERV